MTPPLTRKSLTLPLNRLYIVPFNLLVRLLPALSFFFPFGLFCVHYLFFLASLNFLSDYLITPRERSHPRVYTSSSPLSQPEIAAAPLFRVQSFDAFERSRLRAFDYSPSVST